MVSKNPYQRQIAEILGTRPVAFNPDLARALGSAKAGLLLSQLLYWWDKGRNPGWIYKTIKEIEEETALTRREQETAIRICKEKGVLTVEVRGLPAKRHFALDIGRIVDLVLREQPSSRESASQASAKAPNKLSRSRQANTESTAESTVRDFSIQETSVSNIDYLSDIPEADMDIFTRRFGLTKKEVQRKAEDILLRHTMHGYSSKDIKAKLLKEFARDLLNKKR